MIERGGGGGVEVRRETYSSFHFAEGFCWKREKEKEKEVSVCVEKEDGGCSEERERDSAGYCFCREDFYWNCRSVGSQKNCKKYQIYIEFLLPNVFFPAFLFFILKICFQLKKMDWF